MKESKCLILATHFGDEFLMFGSFLINYPGDIHIAFTHQGGGIAQDVYEQELKESETFSHALSAYREAKGLGVYTIEYFPPYGGICRFGATKQTLEEIRDILENLLSKDKWEYYLYSYASTHKNHLQSNMIAEFLLRDPYIFNIQKILMGNYDPECMVPTKDAGRFSSLRVISEEDMDSLSRLGGFYAQKLIQFPDAQLRKVFAYNGLRIRKPYAQSFYPQRLILTDN